MALAHISKIAGFGRHNSFVANPFVLANLLASSDREIRQVKCEEWAEMGGAPLCIMDEELDTESPRCSLIDLVAATCTTPLVLLVSLC